MRKKPLSALLVILSALLVSACQWPLDWNTAPGNNPNVPGVGDHRLGVPFEWQAGQLYCTLADTQMWAEYAGQGGPSQDDILNWMLNYDPADTSSNGSISPNGIPIEVAAFTGWNVEGDWYNGDAGNRQNATADQKKGISQGRPTITLTEDGFHSVLVVGGSWHALSTEQPDDDYMLVHDSAIGSYINYTIGEWMQQIMSASSGGGALYSVQAAGQKYSTADELSVFNYWGGTYYGDPDPPSGCDLCNPQARLDVPLSGPVRGLLAGWWRFSPLGSRLAAVRMSRSNTGLKYSAASRSRVQSAVPISAGRSATGPRRDVFVPFPNATAAGQIIENFRAGIRQTRIDQMPGFGDLNLDSQLLQVSSVEAVTSLGSHPNYYLLSIATAAGGPYALAAVSGTGWLLAVSIISGVPTELPGSLDWAKDVVQTKIGATATRAHKVYFVSSATAYQSILRPTVRIEAPGRTLYVDVRGRVFEEDPTGGEEVHLNSGVSHLRRVAE